VLATTLKRMAKYLRKRGMHEAGVLRAGESETEDATEARGHVELLGSAASGALPPAGPSFPVHAEGTTLVPKPLQWTTKAPSFDKPLCCAQDGFTLHAATRAGGADRAGREALLKYILRPAVAQERITYGPQGLVRITLKRAFGDGTRAVDMDPLSLLSRLAASVPGPRHHIVRYAGVLASASKMRPMIAPKKTEAEAQQCTHRHCEHAEPSASSEAGQADVESRSRGAYRPWAELLKRSFNRHMHCTWHRGGVRPDPDHTSVPS
jgi:hypothetical protein